VTECEDAPMEGNQLASSNPALDQPLSKALNDQLPVGDHSVLLLGQLSDYKGRLVHRNVFPPP